MFYFILFYAIHNFILFYHFTLDGIRCGCLLIIKRICVCVFRRDTYFRNVVKFFLKYFVKYFANYFRTKMLREISHRQTV